MSWRSQHVVVVGAGYGGLPCALQLAPLVKRHRDRLRVTLINPAPRQELTCEIYRTLRTGEPEFFPFAAAARKRGLDFIEGALESINPREMKLTVRGERREEIRYDHIVLATGNKVMMPPIQGLREKVESFKALERRVFPFKTNADAQNLRLALRRLGWTPEAKPPSFKDLFVVVLGAGATGIEVAGEIAALRGRNPRLRVVLVDQIPDLLPDFSGIARRLLKRELGRMKIETILGSSATKITDHELHTENGQVIPWDLIVLCTGARRHERYAEAFGASSHESGLTVAPNCEVQNFPNHYAIGDLAETDGQIPKRAQFGVQQGYFVAKLLEERILLSAKKPSKKIFEPHDLGYLISLGPSNGIGRIGHLPLPVLLGRTVEKAKWAARWKYLLQLRTGL